MTKLCLLSSLQPSDTIERMGAALLRSFPLFLVLVLMLSGCSAETKMEDPDSPERRSPPNVKLATTSNWIPNIPGVDNANHDPNVKVYTQEIILNEVTMTGLSQAPVEITVNGITMDEDVGEGGSLTLVAEVLNFPAKLTGFAWPALVSLSDGTNELVNVKGCESGFYVESGGSLLRNASCAPDPAGTQGSAFMGTSALNRRLHWEQFQRIGSYTNFDSVNSFPTCSWSAGIPGEPKCSFVEAPGEFFGGGGKLKSGPDGVYRAKYVLLASDYLHIDPSYKATLKLTVIRKIDQNVDEGALDLNVILVGSENVDAASTPKGQQNLNALFKHVYDHFSAANPSVKLGKLNVFEMSGDAGEYFLDTNYDYRGFDYYDDETAFLFSVGTAGLPSNTETKAVNVFLVSTISWGGSGTILGLSAGIGGAPIHGTFSSGVVFSTFGHLDQFNPDCSGDPAEPCGIEDQENEFINMGSTVSHEIGHFLGLNHLSESHGERHDVISDTPKCMNTVQCGSDPDDRCITINSCRQELECLPVCGTYPCPDELKCQFNHVMWWTSKKYKPGGEGDGNLFSEQSSKLINHTGFIQ